MKFPKSHNQKTTPKRHKNRLSEDQLRLLEASFTHEKKLEPERKFQLAYELGLPPKQVATTNIMKFPKSHNQKTTPKRHKNRLSEDQLRLLEASFTHEKKLEPERKFQLAYELGLPPKQVAIWYQNKRARWKTQNIELDYRSIQLRLDSVLADRGRLQKEVMRLRMELQRSQEVLYALNLNQPPVPSLNTSCEEDGSSSLPSDANCPWENTDALRVDEVYAFLMGTSDQTSMLQTNNSLFNPASS